MEKQPARTGSLLLWVWTGGEAAQGGDGVEENRPFSTRSQTSGCKTFCWLEVMGEERKHPTQFSPFLQRPMQGGVGVAQGPRLPTLDRLEASGRAVAIPFQNGKQAGAVGAHWF